MSRRSGDGPGLLRALRAAVNQLAAHVDEVNALNVYPVPDGDTGTNMLATVQAALDEAERVAEPTADRVAGAISYGALMGARGNSGVITSQILRGMAEGLGGKRRFNGLDLAHSLRLGSTTAYAAVAKPVEGTILTVIREASEAAVAAAERTNDLEAVLTVVVEAAERAVARTPSLLPILREAGVVDAGGQGLLRLFQGALQHVATGSMEAVTAHATAGGSRPSVVVAHADEGFGYETMFLLHPAAGQSLQPDRIRAGLEALGQSVLVAGDHRAIKVHVHSERPDEILAFGLGLGTLTRISVENLDGQARDVRERKAAEFTGRTRPGAEPTERPASAEVRQGEAITVPPAPPRDPAGTPSDTVEERAVRQLPNAGQPPTVASAAGHLGGDKVAVIAVAAGDGLAAVFESFGCSAVVAGGQTANPSTGELLAAVESVPAQIVLLLPNNPNVLLAARQVVALSSRHVAVVPTRNAAEGIAALLAVDPTLGAADNVAAMTEAARSIQTLQVTEAVRDAKIGGRRVKRGQTIVLDPDDGLLAVDQDRTKAVLAGLERLASGFELLTVYYGSDADLAEAETLGQAIGARRPELEVEIVRGGQAHYRYLMAAE